MTDFDAVSYLRWWHVGYPQSRFNQCADELAAAWDKCEERRLEAEAERELSRKLYEALQEVAVMDNGLIHDVAVEAIAEYENKERK